jgi:ATP phosphoribosyltransferase regulatory subunit
LYKIIEYYDYQSYVSFDLGLLSNYNYYSGVIFKGYTYGSGSPVVAGGRYNGLVNQFGVDTPSVGFAFFVDELMAALLHQKIAVDTTKRASMVLYLNDYQQAAITFAKKCRMRGETVQLTRKSSRCTIPEYIAYCKNHEIQQIFYFANDDGRANVICVADGAAQTQAWDEMGGAQ